VCVCVCVCERVIAFVVCCSVFDASDVQRQSLTDVAAAVFIKSHSVSILAGLSFSNSVSGQSVMVCICWAIARVLISQSMEFYYRMVKTDK